VTNGDPAGITRRIKKGANPAAPSAVNQQNAFHKLASTNKFTRDTTRDLIAATDSASLGQAAIARDVNGNTPIHLAQHNLGEAETNNNGTMERRYRDLKDQLTTAATNNGHDVNSITNNEGRTPLQMREAGRQAAEDEREQARQVHGNLHRSGLL
jgi:hypothetical protein